MRSSLLLLALVAGCSSSDNPTTPHTGNLTVTVTAPTGLTAQVTITGPGGFTKTIGSTTTLSGIAPGTYTISATDLTTSDPIVASAYHATVTGSPALISVGSNATATVTYAGRQGSGGLWMVGGATVGSSTGNGAIEYTVAQLRASSNATPAVQLQFPATPGGNIDANAVAVDAQGDLWVANDNSNTAVEYTPSVIGASGSPAAAVTIHLPDSSYTEALAFDAKGNLWVLNEYSSTIVAFTPSQLTATGTPTPAITIHMGQIGGQTPTPLSMAFDGQGNLWVTNIAGPLIEYSASQLGSSGTLAPAVTLYPSVPYPYAIAFDKSGNLWAGTTGYGDDTGGIIRDYPGVIIELPAASLVTSGNIAAAVTITLPNGPNTFPTTLAFDDSGDLWYGDFTHSIIGELTPAQLASTGSPTPPVAIVFPVTPRFFGVSMAFNPHTTDVPLH